MENELNEVLMLDGAGLEAQAVSLRERNRGNREHARQKFRNQSIVARTLNKHLEIAITALEVALQGREVEIRRSTNPPFRVDPNEYSEKVKAVRVQLEDFLRDPDKQFHRKRRSKR